MGRLNSRLRGDGCFAHRHGCGNPILLTFCPRPAAAALHAAHPLAERFKASGGAAGPNGVGGCGHLLGQRKRKRLRRRNGCGRGGTRHEFCHKRWPSPSPSAGGLARPKIQRPTEVGPTATAPNSGADFSRLTDHSERKTDQGLATSHRASGACPFFRETTQDDNWHPR